MGPLLAAIHWTITIDPVYDTKRQRSSSFLIPSGRLQASFIKMRIFKFCHQKVLKMIMKERNLDQQEWPLATTSWSSFTFGKCLQSSPEEFLLASSAMFIMNIGKKLVGILWGWLCWRQSPMPCWFFLVTLAYNIYSLVGPYCLVSLLSFYQIKFTHIRRYFQKISSQKVWENEKIIKINLGTSSVWVRKPNISNWKEKISSSKVNINPCIFDINQKVYILLCQLTY